MVQKTGRGGGEREEEEEFEWSLWRLRLRGKERNEGRAMLRENSNAVEKAKAVRKSMKKDREAWK